MSKSPSTLYKNRGIRVTKTQTKSVAKTDSNALAMPGYHEFLNDIKTKIRNSQLKAAIAASKELIEL